MLTISWRRKHNPENDLRRALSAGFCSAGMIRPHRFIGVPDREAILQREPRPGGLQDRDLQAPDLIAHGRGNGHDRANSFRDRVGYVLQPFEGGYMSTRC